MMKKSRIAVLIAAALLGTQVGIAAEEQETAPGADQSVVSELTPLQPVEVVQADSEQRASLEPLAADQPLPAVMHTSAIPPGADDLASKPLPALAKYLDERAARTQTALRGDVFPPGAEELASKPLPALVRYFDQKESNANVASYKGSASSSIE